MMIKNQYSKFPKQIDFYVPCVVYFIIYGFSQSVIAGYMEIDHLHIVLLLLLVRSEQSGCGVDMTNQQK